MSDAAGLEWWATAIIAFGASLGGAGLGAAVSVGLGIRQRLRRARAEILTDWLPLLHDPVAAATKGVAETREPRAHGKEIGDAFQKLDRFAAAASREDYERVHEPVWTRLLRINELNEQYAGTANTPNRAAAARSIAAQQLEEWQPLNEQLNRYRKWLVDDLGRRWWKVRRT